LQIRNFAAIQAIRFSVGWPVIDLSSFFDGATAFRADGSKLCSYPSGIVFVGHGVKF